jgi:hypothetical protein
MNLCGGVGLAGLDLRPGNPPLWIKGCEEASLEPHTPESWDAYQLLGDGEVGDVIGIEGGHGWNAYAA